MDNKCLICGKTIDTVYNFDSGKEFQCSRCGNYKYLSKIGFISDLSESFRKQLSSYIFYHKNSLNKGFVLGDYLLPFQDFPYVSVEMVKEWYPTTFSQKVDIILLYLASLTNYVGEEIKINFKDLVDIYFIDCPKSFADTDKIDYAIIRQIDYLNSFFSDAKYFWVQNYKNPLGNNWSTSLKLTITPTGWARIEELQRNLSNNKNVFVAMKFGSATQDLREKIREGLEGYNVRIMDEIEHNHQIVPEMLYEIRNSRFVVAELSHHNNGAYYEAGYALGLGKEVIHICAKSELTNGLHFDVAQVNTIVYDSIDDIPKLLKKRIKATIL